MKAGLLRTLLALLSPPRWLETTKSGNDSARRVQSSHVDFKKRHKSRTDWLPAHTHTRTSTHTHATLNKRHIFNKPSSICFEAHSMVPCITFPLIKWERGGFCFFLAEVFPSGLNHIHHTLDRAPRLDAPVWHANWKTERFLSPSYLTWIRALKSSILNLTVSQPQTHYCNACGGKDVTAESENVSICYRGPSCLLFSVFQLA